MNAKKYQADPKGEVGEVKKLIAEEIGAGFYNIDVDTSTLVDLSKPTLAEQQRLNFEHAAEITALHSRAGAGGRHGLGRRRDRRGGPQEQHGGGAARLHGGLHRRARGEFGDIEGISKISVQTGTSHGGVVLPDGTIAKVKLDLEALAALSKAARAEVRHVRRGAARRQHAAGRRLRQFPRLETAEIHLATNFQSIVFDHPALPAELRERMYDWLDANAQSERKAGDTPEQFYYKARKKAIGPFKKEVWSLPPETARGDRGRAGADIRLPVRAAQGERHRAAVPKYIKAPYQAHASLQRALVTAVDDAEAGE